MKTVKVKNVSKQTLVFYDGGVRKEIRPDEEATVPANLLRVFAGKVVEVKKQKQEK